MAMLKTLSDRHEASKNISFVWKVRKPSRYSDGGWPVLYTAKRRMTCYAEIGYHLQEYYLPGKKASTLVRVPHIRYGLKVVGVRRDFLHLVSDVPILCASDPLKQAACHDIARSALKAKKTVSHLRVPSARAPGRSSIPILHEGSVSAPMKVSTLFIEVVNTYDYVVAHVGKREVKVAVDRTY